MSNKVKYIDIKNRTYYFLDPRHRRQGSYKFGPIRTSVRPSARTFLENTSFNFSETWHEVRIP